MVDFNRIRNLPKRECQRCGKEFRPVIEDSAVCRDCKYLEEHPEQADMYWTWARSGSDWLATCYWPDKTPDPDTGTVITVHRKDGTASQHSITQVDGVRVDMRAARLRMYCQVGPRLEATP